MKLHILLILALTLTSCSGGEKAVAPKTNTTTQTSQPEEIRPKMGSATFTLPAGWIQSRIQPPQYKDVESISFIRKADEALWANPGPLGTSSLPTMNITISLRPDNAARDDIDPTKLGKSLVKQGVITELVHSDEIRLDGLSATRIVGDTPDQGRIWIVLLAHGGHLYKWTLYGARAKDTDAHKSMELLLSTIRVKR